MHPGPLLKKWRAANDITQADLAKWLKITQQAVSALERGEMWPGARSAFLLSMMTNTDIRMWFPERAA